MNLSESYKKRMKELAGIQEIEWSDKIKWDTIIVEPASANKNINIQLSTKNKHKYLQAKSLFNTLKSTYPELKFFLQGDTNSPDNYWLMFESWSKDELKVLEAAKWLAKELELSSALSENIVIPIKVGDVVLGGKWKNKHIVVKKISKNDKGDITINDKPLMRFRIIKEIIRNILKELIINDIFYFKSKKE